MTDKFQNKYRIPSARASWWDYGANAIYFVTICTQNREHYFGYITGGNMILSSIGQSAHDCWLSIPLHFPFVILGNFVVMPNHVHGIIIIDKTENGNGIGGANVGANGDANGDANVDANVETQNFASLLPTPIPPQLPPPKNKFGAQSQNLASIIRGYKIGVTKFANNHHIKFGWQARFYDHIVRNEESFTTISNYIANNPKNWEKDKFNNLP